MRVVFALLLLMPLAAAQDHAHSGGGYMVVSDVGPDGLAYVGSPTHFELIAFGDDHIPDFHQDLPVRVTLDGDLLYETTATSGHDYDGVHGFDIVFPRAGNWTVEIPGTDASMQGRAIEVARQVVQVEGFIQASNPPGIELTASTPHTDFLIEYLDDGQTVLRTKVHAHTDRVVFQEGQMGIGELTQRVTAFTAAPEQGAPIVPATRTVMRDTGNAIPASIPVVPVAQDKNDVTVVAGDWTLIGTYDPYTQVGPQTLQHLQTLVVDEAGAVVRHMSYDISFRGPMGLIFEAVDGQVHEHDGIYELAARMPIPGQYVMDVTAHHGDWSATMQMTYTVRPTTPLAGPGQIDATITPGNGTQALRATATDGAGNALPHGELEIQLEDAAGLVLLRDKLHSHGDGVFTATMAVPCAQSHLHMDGIPLDQMWLPPAPVTASLEAAHDDCLPRWLADDFGNTTTPSMAQAPDETSPGMPTLLVGALLAACAMAIRRRQR